jgi:hypothetical protein
MFSKDLQQMLNTGEIYGQFLTQMISVNEYIAPNFELKLINLYDNRQASGNNSRVYQLLS